MQPDESSTVNLDALHTAVKLFSDMKSFFREDGSIDWNIFSPQHLESIIRSDTGNKDPVIRKFVNRFSEAINRATNGEQGALDDQTVIKALTDLPKEAVEMMVNNKSFGLTAKEGSMIKKFYDDALDRMSEISIGLTTVRPTPSAEQHPEEIAPEEKLPEPVEEKKDFSTLPPEPKNQPEEDSTKVNF